MTHSTLRGAGTALVTPFQSSGEIDEAALRRFVAWQIEQGIDFVVPCGSTGEAATMSVDEQRRVVEVVADVAQGRVPVVAGAGANDTAKAIALSKVMRDAGATHLLHTSPSYNRPPQRGIVAHFQAVADATALPIVLYNVPSRTGSNMEAATTLTLAQHPNVIAIKEASGNLAQITEILNRRPDGFAVFSGDDALTLAIMASGGEGVISVTSNIVPALVAQLAAALNAGDLARARQLDQTLWPLTTAAFIEPNPMAVKAAMSLLGMMDNVLRSPMVPLLTSHTETVRAALVAAGALAA